MARIKITDLPKDMTISKDEMRRVRGGAFDAFMKIRGIGGESTDPLPMEEVTFTRQVDRSTPA